ncbi:hypothetical protein DV738_g5125, partial [Chaetothyriales sp. CBS 135597]
MRRSGYRAPSLHPNAHDTRRTRLASATTTTVAVAVAPSPLNKERTDAAEKAEEEDVMRLPDSSSSEDEAEQDKEEAPPPPTVKKKTSPKRKFNEIQAREAQPTRESKRARRQRPRLQDSKDIFGMMPPPSLPSSQRESLKLKRVYTSSARKKEELKKEEHKKEELKMFKPDIKLVGGGGGEEEDDGDEGRRRLQIKKLPPPLPSSSPEGGPGLADEPVNIITLLTGLAVLRLCRKQISITLLHDGERKMKMQSLSLKSQRDICHRHQLAEARDLAHQRGYPVVVDHPVDWAELERVRIPRLLTHLRRVLLRQTPSFYLDQLDVHAAAAKAGRPKRLRTYLQVGVLDVVKPGYYGPKGQRVVCDAVMNLLAADLRQASRDDNVVHAAGVGAYVAAVLIPECTMRLVMEDMRTRSQDRARDILAESSDIGRLLNPDDDRIELVDGE